MRARPTGGRILVTSIVRRAGRSERSGRVRLIDAGSGRTLFLSGFAESTHRRADLSPRGGLRGVRGVSVFEDRLVIANAEALFVFGPDWRLVRRISHPWMGGVHGMLAEEEGLWVTCTSADLLVRFDWAGRPTADWEWRRDRALAAELGLPGVPPVHRGLDYRDPAAQRGAVRNAVHLNAVARGRQGLLLSLGRILAPVEYRRALLRSRLEGLAGWLGLRRAPGAGPAPNQADRSQPGLSSSALVLLEPEGSSRILHREIGTVVPNHDVLETGEGLLFNDSNRDRLVLVGREGDRSEVGIPGDPAFARGLAAAGDGTFWVGSQHPAAIYQVELRPGGAGRIVRRITFDAHPAETVYGVCRVPRRFGPPPGFLSPVDLC